MKSMEHSLHTPFQVCTQCVMDTTDFEIYFDENGVCNHCLFFEKVLKKNWLPNVYGGKKLDSIIKNIQQEGRNNHYDCVIGISGGVDSR